jgi:hypothetical protein
VATYVKSETQSRLGAGALKSRLTLSSGQGNALSPIVVFTDCPRTIPCRPIWRIRRGHRAAGNADPFAPELAPDLADAVDAEVLLPDPPDLAAKNKVAAHARRRLRRIGPPRALGVRRRRDWQLSADRLDP